MDNEELDPQAVEEIDWMSGITDRPRSELGFNALTRK